MIGKFLKLFFGIGLRDNNLHPESDFRVKVSDDEIICFTPDGANEVIPIKELQNFEIITNDSGPFTPDVFWVFSATQEKCVVPQGASGDGELLEWAQENLRGFDSKKFIQTMGSTDNDSFLIWLKELIPTANDHSTLI